MKKLATVLAIATMGMWTFACGTEGDVDMGNLDQSDEAIEFLDEAGMPCAPDLDTWVAGNQSPDGPQDGSGSQSGEGEPSEDCDGSGEPAADHESDRTEVTGRGCDAYGCCGVPSGSQGEGGGGSGNGAGDGTGEGEGGGGSGNGSGGEDSESGGGGGSGNGSGGSTDDI